MCPNIFLPFPELGTKCPQHINSAFFVFILYVNYLCICHTTLNLKTNFEKEKKHFFRDIQSFCKGCNGFIWQSFRLLNICVIWFWLTSCCNRWFRFYIISIVPSLAAPPFDISDLWSIFLGKYFPFSGGILVQMYLSWRPISRRSAGVITHKWFTWKRLCVITHQLLLMTYRLST